MKKLTEMVPAFLMFTAAVIVGNMISYKIRERKALKAQVSTAKAETAK